MTRGSKWFRRFYKECKKISPKIRFKRIRLGYYRIYWRNAYMHEVYEKMPKIGYDLYDYDPRFENKGYYEEYEDRTELNLKIKNFVEGYYDSIDKIKTRVYLMKNNKEYNERATNAFKTLVIK